MLIPCIGACGTSKTQQSPRPFAAAHSKPYRSASSKPAPSEPYAYPVITRPEYRQLAGFALLRTSPEGLPADVQRVLRAPVFGLNWNLAQRIPVRFPGAYWLVPGDGYLCMIARDSLGSVAVGTTCATTSQALEHGVADVAVTPPGKPASRQIVGVAPDGARQVLVHTSGTVETAPVVGEVFVLHDSLAAPPDSLTVRRAKTGRSKASSNSRQ